MDEEDDEVGSGGAGGVYAVGEEFCEAGPFCWLAFPLPFALLACRLKP